MMKWLPVLAFACLSSEAAACSCIVAHDDAAAFARADLVFSGRAVSREAAAPDPDDDDDFPNVDVSFDVAGEWKGRGQARVTVTTPAHGSACGCGFQVGQAYLVYADLDREGRAWTNICTNTRRLASPDLRSRAYWSIAWLAWRTWPGGAPPAASMSVPLLLPLVVAGALAGLLKRRGALTGRRIALVAALGLLPSAAMALRDDAIEVPAELPLMRDDASAERLLDELRGRPGRWRRQACHELATRVSEVTRAAPAIAALLDASQPTPDRIAAASSLGMIGPPAVIAAPELAAVLDDEDPSIGREAAIALRRIGPGAAPAIASLVAAFGDEAERVSVRERLDRMGPDRLAESRELLPRLAGMDERRHAIAWALSSMGSAAGPLAVDPIVDALLAGRLAPEAASCLRSMGVGERAAHRLAEALDDADARTRVRIFSALGALGPDAAPARSALETARLHPVWAIRRPAELALMAMGSTRPLDPAGTGAPIRSAAGGDRASVPRLPLIAVHAQASQAGSRHELIAMADHSVIASGYSARQVGVLDLVTGELRPLLVEDAAPLPEPGARTSFGWRSAVVGDDVVVSDPDAHGDAIGGGALFVFDGVTGRMRARLDDPAPRHRSRFGQSLAAGAGLLVASSPGMATTREWDEDGVLHVFSIDGSLVASVPHPIRGCNIRDCSLAVMGDRIAVGMARCAADGGNGTVRLLDARTGATLRSLRGPDPSILDFGSQLVALDDSTLLVAARARVYLFDVDSGMPAWELGPPPDTFESDFPRRIVAIDSARFVIGTNQDDRWQALVYDGDGRLMAVARRPVERRGIGHCNVAIAGARLIVAEMFARDELFTVQPPPPGGMPAGDPLLGIFVYDLSGL